MKSEITNLRATRWAKAIVKGDLIAGTHVVNACKRYLNELEMKDRYLCLDSYYHMMDFVTGIYIAVKGQPVQFDPFCWQEFSLVNLFAMKNPDGSNLRTIGYLETGKGSGKTPLGAVIALYATCRDLSRHEVKSLLYGPSQKQAESVMAACSRMVIRSSMFNGVLATPSQNMPDKIWDCMGRGWSIEGRNVPKQMNRLDSGDEPVFVSIEELHEINTSQADAVGQLRRSFKSQDDPLFLMLTNAPKSGQLTLCGQERALAMKVAEGEDDSYKHYFAYIACLDNEEEAEDETMWVKANPSLPSTPRIEKLREEAARAEETSRDKRGFLRLNMGISVDTRADDIYITGGFESVFDKTLELPDSDTECWLGNDTGKGINSYTATAVIWQDPDNEGILCAEVKGYIPTVNLKKVMAASYGDRVQELLDTGGIIGVNSETVEPESMVENYRDLFDRHNIVMVGTDRYGLNSFIDVLRADLHLEAFKAEDKDKDEKYIDGLPVVPLNPTAFMTRFESRDYSIGHATRELVDLINRRKIRIIPNQYLQYCFDYSAFEYHRNGEMMFARHLTDSGTNSKNDGLMALIHGLTVALQGVSIRKKQGDNLDLSGILEQSGN